MPMNYLPEHPGVVLLREFLLPFDISQNALARLMNVPPRRINEIVLGKRSVTADTAIGLAEAFGTRPQFWLSLQANFDIDQAEKRRQLAPIRPPRSKRGQYIHPGWALMEGDAKRGDNEPRHAEHDAQRHDAAPCFGKGWPRP